MFLGDSHSLCPEAAKQSAIAEQGGGMRHVPGDMAIERDEIYCGFHGMRLACCSAGSGEVLSAHPCVEPEKDL